MDDWETTIPKPGLAWNYMRSQWQWRTNELGNKELPSTIEKMEGFEPLDALG